MRTAVCFSLLLAAAPACGQEFPYAATVAADGLPVHAGPLADDYVTATLPRGAEVTVVRHDPDGRAMVRPPAGAFSFAKLEWLTMTAGSPEAGGTATVTAPAGELYCRVGSRAGEAPMIEQIPLKPGQSVTVSGVTELPGEGGPERWAKIPSPAGEHRWVQLRYLVPHDAAARAARDLDPYAVPAGAGTDAPELSADGFVAPAGFEDFAPTPAEAGGSGAVELAFEPPRPLPGSHAATIGGPVPGAAVQAAAADQFGLGGFGAGRPVASGNSASSRDLPGWESDGPSPADRFAATGAEAVAADRRRLDELDAKLNRLPDQPPTGWDLDELASDLRDLRDRAGSKSVRRLASARLVRVDALRTVRGRYAEYVDLTAATDRRDAVLTAEATETLKRFAEVVPPYAAATAPQYEYSQPPRTAAGPGGGSGPLDAGAPALPAPGDVRQMSHTTPAGPAPGGAKPAGAVAFDAVGVLREVLKPAHPQAPRFALVGADGKVAAYLKEDPRLNLPGRAGGTFGVNGRRFRHPAIAAPMIAVGRLVPVKP